MARSSFPPFASREDTRSLRANWPWRVGAGAAFSAGERLRATTMISLQPVQEPNA